MKTIRRKVIFAKREIKIEQTDADRWEAYN